MARLSSNRQHRLSSETDEQRSVRLARLSSNQQHRLSSETDEQRRSRLIQLSRNHQQRRSSRVPILDPPAELINKFHEDLHTLKLAMCSTCFELSFAGLPYGTTCIRCSRDSSVIKLYSHDNNMDPGSVPSQLQVYIHYFAHYNTCYFIM